MRSLVDQGRVRQVEHPASDDEVHPVTGGGERGVQPSELVAEQAAGGTRGHHTQPHLVGDRDDVH